MELQGAGCHPWAEGRGCYSILVAQHPSPYAMASKSIPLTQAQGPSIFLLGVQQSPEPCPNLVSSSSPRPALLLCPPGL